MLRMPGLARAPRPALGRFFRATTTPAKLRLLLVGLVVLCLVWGGLAAWVVSQRAAGGQRRRQHQRAAEPGRPADLPGTVGRGRHRGQRLPVGRPGAARWHRHRYQADIAQAAAHLESATAAAGHSPAARDLATLSAGLPVYTGEVQTARADNRLGLPLGAAYLREASALMRGTLLPAARDVSAQADAQLTAASGQATGLPLALILLVAGVLLGYVLYRAQRWLFQRTHRRLNPGLVVASVAAVVSLLWLAIAFTVARADLLQARDHGSTPVAALARADIAALQARADESLTLIDAGGDDSFEADFMTDGAPTGPRAGHAADERGQRRPRKPGGRVGIGGHDRGDRLVRGARQVRALDDNGRHTQAVRLVTTPAQVIPAPCSRAWTAR